MTDSTGQHFPFEVILKKMYDLQHYYVRSMNAIRKLGTQVKESSKAPTADVSAVDQALRLRDSIDAVIDILGEHLAQPEVGEGLRLLEDAFKAANMKERQGTAAAIKLARKVIPDQIPANPDPAMGKRLWQALRTLDLGDDPMASFGYTLEHLAKVLAAAAADEPIPKAPSAVKYEPPPIKLENLMSIISTSLYHNFRSALATKAFRETEGERWPVADLSTAKGTMKALAQLRPDPLDVEPYLDTAELELWQARMRENVMAMDDLTADVLDVISAVWLKQATHPEAMATVTADDFLRLRGLQPRPNGEGRRGGFTEEQRRLIAKHIAILANTWISVAEMDVIQEVQTKTGIRRKKTKWRGESRGVVVSGRVGQVRVDGTLDTFAWRVRPGDVFAKFLFGPGRQTALLSQKALQYHPDKQRWEKRLTRYLAYLWRIRQGSGTYMDPIKVSTLLEAVKEPVYEPKPTRTKERLEKALDTLQADHVIAGWQYVDADESIVGTRGWAAKWLEWQVLIEPPQEILEHYATIKPQPAAKALPTPKPTTDVTTLNGEFDLTKLRAYREARGLTLLQMAEETGVSAPTLSRIERTGKASKAIVKRLEKWFAENYGPER